MQFEKSIKISFFFDEAQVSDKPHETKIHGVCH